MGKKYLKGHLLTCLLRLIARHEQEIPNWKMKTKTKDDQVLRGKSYGKKKS